MTALDLDEAERLSNAATPGPWRVCAMALAVGGATDRTADYLTDRAFVAHARTFVPLAVARIRELEAARARIGEVLSAEGCSCDCGHDNEGHDMSCAQDGRRAFEALGAIAMAVAAQGLIDAAAPLVRQSYPRSVWIGPATAALAALCGVDVETVRRRRT